VSEPTSAAAGVTTFQKTNLFRKGKKERKSYHGAQIVSYNNYQCGRKEEAPEKREKKTQEPPAEMRTSRGACYR